MYDLRPGEACISNRTAHRQIVTTRRYVDPRSRPFRLGLEPDVPYIVTAAFGGREAALEIDHDYGPRVQLDETATRGEIPVVFGPSDSAQIGEFLRGRRRLSVAERVEQMVKRYDLPDAVTGSVVVKLVDAGFGEGEAVQVMKEAHAREGARQNLFRFSWGPWADTLIEAREQALARAGGGRM